MEKALVARCRNRLWSVIFGGLLLWLALISLFHANPIHLVNYRSIYVAESYTQNNIVWSDDASTKGEIGRRSEGLELNEDESDSSSVEEGLVHINNRGEIGRSFEGVEIKEDASDRSSVEGGLVHENTEGEIGRPFEGAEEVQEDATDSSSVEGGFVHSNTKGEIGRTFEGAEEFQEDATDGSSVEGGLVSKTNSLLPSSVIAEKKAARQDGDSMSCEGRYIFVYRLPRQFNVDLLRHCRSLSNWTDMCDTLANYGLGPRLPNSNKVLGNTGWYDTNQFSLEVIFHNRMKQYKCLTDDSSVASAIFVPYYAGLDVARYLWDTDKSLRDAGPSDLVRWLRRRPEWKVMGGKDHFLVAGRIVWDFRRENEEPPNWGNNLMVLPESMNMTILVLESSLVPKANDFAVPYPTYFHPSKDIEVRQWQRRMRSLKRPYLFSFAGAPRKNLRNSIRNEIISQCRASRRRCNLLECSSRGKQCYNPIFLMKLFQSSIFCLQPPGDSYTRRSAFDSILAGCIPVFFHSGSAYDQYKWHLPADHSRYSVFIPENLVKDGKAALEKLLLHIPRKDVSAMQEEVIRLIPAILYADPTSELETLEDAFDLSVKGVLERIKRIREETLG